LGRGCSPPPAAPWDDFFARSYKAVKPILDRTAATVPGLSIQTAIRDHVPGKNKVATVTRALMLIDPELWDENMCEYSERTPVYLKSGVQRAPAAAALARIDGRSAVMKRAKTKHAPDPIFVVIRRHRQKLAQRDELHDEKKAARADDRVIDEEHLLATTMPTTMAGVVALVEYVAKQEASGSELAVRPRPRLPGRDAARLGARRQSHGSVPFSSRGPPGEQPTLRPNASLSRLSRASALRLSALRSCGR
jgi:hypothetical protein